MKFERDDAKVGLLVLAALAVFASFALHRTLRLLFSRETVHQVVLGNVADLSAGTEVQLQGLRVGQTNTVEMRRDGTEYRFVATIGVRPDVVLWKGTKGVVVTRLVGGSYLELRLPPPAQRRAELKPGEAMDGETAASVNSLVASLDELTGNLNRSVLDLRSELKGRGLESLVGHPDVRGALREATAAFSSFRVTAKVTERTLSHGDVALAALDRNMASLEKSLAVVGGLLERRGTDIDELIGQLGTTLGQLRQAAAELDLLLKNAGPEAVEGLRALSRTLRSTQELVEILRARPSRVVFGTPSDREREEARRRVEESNRTPAPVPTPR